MKNNVFLRLATIKDTKDIFELSNDQMVRQNSINKSKISWDDHVVWFTKKLANLACSYYVVTNQDTDFIGQVRIDSNEKNIISLSISPQFRGQGYATKVIKMATIASNEKKIYAYVMQNNQSSLRAFLNAGYVVLGSIDINGDSYLECVFYNKVFIIAEMSANHCGDLDLAKKIILKAKECGADAVKIQTYTADTITIDCKSDMFKISGGTLWDNKYLYDLYKEAYTPWEWQTELKRFADSVGITLFSSPFDKTAVDFLESIDCPIYKIASFEAIDIPLIKYAASKGKPMIISTGICTEEEIQDAIDACKSQGNTDITLLKCTSAYPARPEDMNLLTIPDMIAKFGHQGVKIGLSDHTMEIETVVAGVALGARVIEKHFTLDRTLGGADAEFSLNPEELTAAVQAIRKTEKLLGAIDYSVNEKNRRFARSLFVVKDIKKGELITEENIRSIRPSCGLHPKYYEEIIGKTATSDLSFGKPIEKGDYL